MLRDFHPHRLVIFSRDELKQQEMRVSRFDHPSLLYFIGDVCDVDCLRRAMHGVDIVVHAAVAARRWRPPLVVLGIDSAFVPCAQYVHTIAKEQYGTSLQDLEWAEVTITRLYLGKVSAVLGGLRHMQLGSGRIESANKFICHVRLKRSVARWYAVNNNQMLVLRGALGDSYASAFWH